MFPPLPRHLPDEAVEDLITRDSRPIGPPVAVITVTRGVDPRARRDPATLDAASPYFATSSEAPRTP